MDHLRKVTGDLRTRGHEETGHKAGGVTQRIQALNTETEEDREEEDAPCGKRAGYGGTEGTTGSPCTDTAQPSTPRAAASLKGSPRSTPGYQPIPAPRSRLPAPREEAQPGREEPHQLGTSTRREVGPGIPEFYAEDDNTSFASEAERCFDGLETPNKNPSLRGKGYGGHLRHN